MSVTMQISETDQSPPVRRVQCKARPSWPNFAERGGGRGRSSNLGNRCETLKTASPNKSAVGERKPEVDASTNPVEGSKFEPSRFKVTDRPWKTSWLRGREWLGNLVFSTMWINLQMLMGDKVGKFSAGMPVIGLDKSLNAYVYGRKKVGTEKKWLPWPNGWLTEDVHLSICPISGPRRALIDSGDISIDVPPPQPRLNEGRGPDAIKDAAKMDREQNSCKTLIVIPEDRGPVLLLKDVFNGMPVHEEVLSNQVALIAQSICVLRPAAPRAGGAAACKLSTQLGFRG
ncbi:hypothetical protein Bbelb_312390 [Branchiostoma belcheri]|nr:hypothetical protein Bbelb_312390 [Branchiostoma belcheri]